MAGAGRSQLVTVHLQSAQTLVKAVPSYLPPFHSGQDSTPLKFTLSLPILSILPRNLTDMP